MWQNPDQPDAEPGKSSPGSGRFEDDMLALLPQLRRYSRSLTRSDTDSEDLLHDCVETALTRRAQWRGVNLKAWALAIMTNLYRNNHRFTVRHPLVDIEEAEELAAPAAADDPLERDRLRIALDALSAEYRAVLMLVVVEGYSYQEVAELLDVPIGTVMSRLSRARERLRETLAQSNIISLRRPR
ncbi:RNA polymerase sigma factor [Pseudomonas sp. R2.Fl]|nr:RNA polymerase sigma factor [Pseudomonas sp. R2.Fl]